MVLLLCLLQLGYRWWASRPGYFWQDDYFLIAWADANPLRPFVTLPFSDHFQPLGLSLLWLCQHLAPGSYDAAMLWTATVYAASMWMLYRLLDEVFGWRAQLYIPLLISFFSALTLQAYLWYSVSVWLAPYIFFSLVTLRAGWAYAQRRGALRLLFAGAAMTALVLAHQFAVLVPVLLLGMLAVVPHVGTAGRSLGIRAVLRYWRLWVVLVLPTALLVVYYAQRFSTRQPSASSPVASLDFIWREITSVILPTLFGGPWRYNGYLSPEWPLFTPLGVLLVVQVVLVLVLLLPRIKPRSAALWIFVALVIVSGLAAVALGRGSSGAPAVVMRYGAAAVVPLAIGLAYSISEGREERDGWRREGTEAAAAWRRSPRVLRAVAVTAVLQVFLVAATFSASVPVFENPTIPNRAYVESASAALASSGGRELLPQMVPGYVIGSAFAPAPPSTQVVFGPRPYSVPFVSQVDQKLWGLTEAGRLVQQRVEGIRSWPGPNGACGTAIVGLPVRMPLAGNVDFAYSTVDLGTLSQETARVRLELLAGSTVAGSAEVTVRPGLRRTFLGLGGYGDAVRVVPLTDGHFCVTDVIVGQRVHDEGGRTVRDPVTAPLYDYSLTG